jgi:hypothetical protein
MFWGCFFSHKFYYITNLPFAQEVRTKKPTFIRTKSPPHIRERNFCSEGIAGFPGLCYNETNQKGGR